MDPKSFWLILVVFRLLYNSYSVDAGVSIDSLTSLQWINRYSFTEATIVSGGSETRILPLPAVLSGFPANPQKPLSLLNQRQAMQPEATQRLLSLLSPRGVIGQS